MTEVRREAMSKKRIDVRKGVQGTPSSLLSRSKVNFIKEPPPYFSVEVRLTLSRNPLLTPQ